MWKTSFFAHIIPVNLSSSISIFRYFHIFQDQKNIEENQMGKRFKKIELKVLEIFFCESPAATFSPKITWWMQKEMQTKSFGYMLHDIIVFNLYFVLLYYLQKQMFCILCLIKGTIFKFHTCSSLIRTFLVDSLNCKIISFFVVYQILLYSHNKFIHF